jgi:hypothetical protein
VAVLVIGQDRRRPVGCGLESGISGDGELGAGETAAGIVAMQDIWPNVIS